MTSILQLTTDNIIDIIKYLDFNTSIMIIGLFKLYNRDLLYYNDEKIFNIINNVKIEKYLNIYNIPNLYECIINSSFKLLEVHDNLNLLSNITKANKTYFTINYYIENDNVSLDKILNTINILNIYIDIVRENTKDFIINNPYNYLLLYVTDKLFIYLLDVSIYNNKIKHKIHSKKNHNKIQNELYDYKWNKTNISIYYLIQLYLVSINMITNNDDNLKPIIVNYIYKKETDELINALKLFYSDDVNNLLDDNLRHINTQDIINANINI